MPTNTFFRLPEEKRQRLIQAAWDEFTRVDLANASINRIIRAAHIPRGSFYQYFGDKEELFRYLLGDMREYFSAVQREILEGSGGDLFALPLAAFDRFINQSGSTEPALGRFVQVMRLNQGMDVQRLMGDRRCPLSSELMERAQLAGLRERDSAYVDNVFFLLVAALAFAVMETINHPEKREEQRRALEERVKIIQYGSSIKDKEETHAE